MSKKATQFDLWVVFALMTVIACILAYVFRPLREVIYVESGNYGGRSDVVEFVESGRRVKVDIDGKVGDKFKMQSWMK